MDSTRVISPVTRYAEGRASQAEDPVSVEEPLEIFVDGSPFYLTMRLPGEEMQLALGLCYTEGIIDSFEDVLTVNYCGEDAGNRIEVLLEPRRKSARNAVVKGKCSAAYSSCGICGKDMIEDLMKVLPEKRTGSMRVKFNDINSLHEMAEKRQHVFKLTGGTHGAAVFTADRGLLAFSEDVGRHNALDKAIGTLLFSNKIRDASIVLLTSRLSYEMVQKTGRLGNVEVLMGASSATSLAVEVAGSIGLTLIGFSRKGRGNVYTHPERIVL